MELSRALGVAAPQAKSAAHVPVSLRLSGYFLDAPQTKAAAVMDAVSDGKMVEGTFRNWVAENSPELEKVIKI